VGDFDIEAGQTRGCLDDIEFALLRGGLKVRQCSSPSRRPLPIVCSRLQARAGIVRTESRAATCLHVPAPAAFLHGRCKPSRKPGADKHAERKHSGADNHSRRLAGQHPLPGPHAMAVCDWSVNTLTVPVATASVRSPDMVPTTTVKASAIVSLFMVNPPRMALSSHASLFSGRIYDANVAQAHARRARSRNDGCSDAGGYLFSRRRW
jgi:hypothetical protein